MKKLFTYAISAGIIIVLTANSSLSDSSLLGSWSFSVNGAPWEFNSGSMIFEQSDDAELEGKIVFHTGREIKVQNLSVNEEEFEFTVDVDGYDVQAIFSVDENQIRGQAISIEGNMPFTATRETDKE